MNLESSSNNNNESLTSPSSSLQELMDEVYELQKQTQEKIGDLDNDPFEKQLLAKLDGLQSAIIEAQLQGKNDISSLREQFDIIKDTQESITSLQRHIKNGSKHSYKSQPTGKEYQLDPRFTESEVIADFQTPINTVITQAEKGIITGPVSNRLKKLGIEDSKESVA